MKQDKEKTRRRRKEYKNSTLKGKSTATATATKLSNTTTTRIPAHVIVASTPSHVLLVNNKNLDKKHRANPLKKSSTKMRKQKAQKAPKAQQAQKTTTAINKATAIKKSKRSKKTTAAKKAHKKAPSSSCDGAVKALGDPSSSATASAAASAAATASAAASAAAGVVEFGRKKIEHLLDLDPDVLKLVLDKVRSDRRPHGNTTIFGFIAETSWRLVCKAFLDLSKTHPSNVDAIICHTTPLPRACPCAESYSIVEPSFPVFYASEFACMHHALHVIRHPSSNRVELVISYKEYLCRCYYVVLHRLSLPDAVRLLGGHNAYYDTRLTGFDSLAQGLFAPRMYQQQKPCQAIKAVHISDNTLVQVFAWIETVSIETVSVTETASAAKSASALSTHHHVQNSSSSKVMLNSWHHGIALSLVSESGRKNAVPKLSAFLGYYEPAFVAELKGWQVSLHSHGLPSELIPKGRDTERINRVLAKAALARFEDKKYQLVVASPNDCFSIVAASRPHRCAAAKAKKNIRLQKNMLVRRVLRPPL